MVEDRKWWSNPQGIVAAIAIATAILGFFYARERQLWEDKRAIESLEERGSAAILEFKNEQNKIQLRISALERAVWVQAKEHALMRTVTFLGPSLPRRLSLRLPTL
jgi:hypothetical protein